MIQSQALTSVYALEQLTKIDEICNEYGLYGRIVNYRSESSVLGSGRYVVIGKNPVDDDVKPYKLSNRVIRDPDLFYPHEFAIELTDKNAIIVFNEVMEFCKNAEFLSTLYAEYKTTLPECIRYSELSGLKNLCEGRANRKATERYRSECEKGLKRFFKNENSSFKQEKRKFFRSERFDDKVKGLEGFLAHQKDFENRESPIIRLPVLLQSSKDTAKKKIRKSKFDAFVRYMKKVYPEVLFAVSEKEVIDLGLIEQAKKLPEDDPFFEQKPITDEEFQKIIKERFAEEGFNCTNDVRPAYWEFYDIYYKKVDEPQIIGAYNDIYLAFADHEPLQTIKARGPMKMIDLPVDDFHYFVALAKSKGLDFHIDHRGKFSVPSFTDIHVVYSAYDEHIMNEIVDNMLSNNILNSHIVAPRKITEPLNQKITDAKEVCSVREKIGSKENKDYERN